MADAQIKAFLAKAKTDDGLKQQLRDSGSDPVAIAQAAGFSFTAAALARSLGYAVSAADVLKFQAQQVLRRTDQELAQPQHQLKVRHWGCWLDVV